MQTYFNSKGEMLSATLYGTSSASGVVLCPPHPLYGGSQNDTRLVRIARELASHNISALCFDYGSYGKGVEEVQNTLDAIAFLQKSVPSVGLLGYSFGAVVASNAATHAQIDGFVAISILKRVDGLLAKLEFTSPKLLVHGKRDTVAPYTDFESLFNEAKGSKEKLVLGTDHFYMGDFPAEVAAVAEAVCKFFKRVLSNDSTDPR